MSQEIIDNRWLELCLKLAQRAAKRGEVPVGAVIVNHQSNQLVAKAFNLRESLASPLAHAEVLAIHRASKKLGQWRLSGHTLYTSLEPCVMCSGVIIQSRIDRVIYSAHDPKGGGQSLFELLARPELNHRPQLSFGSMETESRLLLQDFFKQRRLVQK